MKAKNSVSCHSVWKCSIQVSFTVVDIGLMQTSYTTSEAMGIVSVCVNISSAQLARNISATLTSVTAGAAVGKPSESYTQAICISYIGRKNILQSVTKICM